MQVYPRSLENRTRQDVVGIVALVTVPATYPVILALARYPVGTAEGAGRLISPARLFQVGDAVLLCRELAVNFGNVDRSSPVVDYTYSIPDLPPFVKPQTANCQTYI